MTYATTADLEREIGQKLLDSLGDRDGDGQDDVDVVEQALKNATATINSYLSVRYALPLSDAQTTDVLNALCIDITVYRLAISRLKQTVEMRTRYEDAIRLLERIADGKANLGAETDPDAEADDGEAPTGSEARILTVTRG